MSAHYSFLLLVCTSLQFIVNKSDAAPVSDKVDTNSAVKYLAQFGYLPTPDPRKALLLTEDGVSKALKNLQKFGGINATGVLDDETIELMKTPRCGMKDNLEKQNLEIREIGDDEDEEVEKEERGPYFPTKKRKKRFALQGSRWKTRFLTYKIGKYPTGLTKREVLIFFAPLKVWKANQESILLDILKTIKSCCRLRMMLAKLLACGLQPLA